MRSTKRIFPSSHYALLALFFFAGLELTFAIRDLLAVIVSIVLVVTAVGIIFIRAEERGGFHSTQSILPILAALGTTSFSLFVPAGSTLHLYFAGSAWLFFTILKYGAKQAYPTWNWVISLIILFLVVASVLGWRFSFYTPIFLTLTIVYVSAMLIAIQSLLRYTWSAAEAWLLALSIAFVISEVIWALQFLPLHFIVQAGVVVTVYYVLFQLTSTSYERTVSRSDIAEHVGVGVVALVILLFTARWS